MAALLKTGGTSREGYEIFGPVPSVERGLTLIGEHRPTVAVLDIQLRDERSYPLAEQLVGMGVPIVFMTGYGREELPSHLAKCPLISKFDGFEAVKAEVSALLGNRGQI